MSEQTVSRFDLRKYGDISIAILSDTHGELDQHVREVVSDCDVALHAGDIMGAAVLTYLKPKLGIVIAVRGNNDFPATWRGDEAGVLDSLCDIALVDVQGGEIAVEHGHRLHNIKVDHFPLAYKFPQTRMVVYGHTHVQRLDQDQQPWLINPGAAGRSRNKGGASCYRLQVTGNGWTVEGFKFAPLRRAG